MDTDTLVGPTRGIHDVGHLINAAGGGDISTELLVLLWEQSVFTVDQFLELEAAQVRKIPGIRKWIPKEVTAIQRSINTLLWG